jgi:hypothetical protein
MIKFYLSVFLLAVCQSVHAQSLAASFNKQNVCKGGVEKINFTAAGSFSSDNYFRIQLSDSSGDFSNALELASFYDKSFQEIAFVIPVEAAPGTHYRIRAVSTNPVTGSTPTSVLSVLDSCTSSPLSAITIENLSATTICTNTATTVSWKISGTAFNSDHFFTVQMSDSSGSFTAPYNLASTGANTSAATFTIPQDFVEGSKYRIRVIATSPGVISNIYHTNLSIRHQPVPTITTVPAKPCSGDTIRLIVRNDKPDGNNYIWAGPLTITKDTLLITSANLAHEGVYEATVMRNGCSVTASQSLVLGNCKPAWSWALNDTFWSITHNFPSTIVDTETDQENNLYIAGFFSQTMLLGGKMINSSNIFCDNLPNSDKRTGFIAKISADGNLLWHRKWNSQSDISDYQYCDIALDNGRVFLVSEFSAAANCPADPTGEASLIMTDETDTSLGSIAGYCKYNIQGTSPAQFEYRYKGRFMWLARFDTEGNLDTLTNLTELKTCGISADNFDSKATYGLGAKGYYSLKARNNNLWLLYTWNQGLTNTLKFGYGYETTNEAAGLIAMQLNPVNLDIINYQKLNVYSPSGALGMSNLEIDAQNNVIVTGSTATIGLGTALAVSFGPHPLIFGDTDYFVAKFITASKSWAWARQSQLILLDSNADAAPAIKTDSQNNIYLGFSLKTSYGGNFANITLPITPQDFDENNTAALLKLNSNGDGQWVKLNNHTMRNGRNAMAVDYEDNIYFTTYLNNSATAASFLINEHRLPQKELATFSSTSGNPFVAIYKPTGDLMGSVNNIRVYDALYVNGLVVDNHKSIILGGINYGKADFGKLSISTNDGNQTGSNDNRRRAFLTKIGNPQSIAPDNTDIKLCTGIESEIKFNTTGDFGNTSFNVEFVDILTNKAHTVATGNASPIKFIIADSLAGKLYYTRIVTSDNLIASTILADKTIEVNTAIVPVISSNLLGTIPVQDVCHTSLQDYRIKTNITGVAIILKRNEQVVYTGENQDFAPTEQQTGIYKAVVEHQGCTAESASLDFRVSHPASARLIGSQVLDNFDSSAYLSLILEGGGEYNVSIAGIPSALTLNKNYETIEVNPSQNTTYTLTSVSNHCGPGTVSGSASISLCETSLSLLNPTDNYDTGTIIKETNSTYGEIVASNEIRNDAKVIYSAGKSVMLNPGFYASKSGVFTAEIKGCKNLRTRRDRDFKLGYQKLHINRPEEDKTIAEMTEFAERGARLFEVTLRLDEVFRSLAQFNETNPEKLDKAWSLYDKVIKHANNVYDHVVFRINVDYDDTRYYFQDRDEKDPAQMPYNTYENALFNLFGEIVQDQFNNPARIAYGSGHGSFSSLSATAKMKGFVQKVLDRYYPVLGQKLYWVSVVSTAQYESGFNYENSWDGENFISPRPCEYDYSPDNVNAFRNWLVTERYTSLADVNAAYNTNYSESGQIEPPKVNVDNITYMNAGNVTAMYNSVLFEDWYHFNYGQMKKFLLDCKGIIKAKNEDIKFCFEAGSVADQLSAARKTFDVPDMNTYADILKTNMPNITFGGLHTWEADIVRSNFNGEIQTEINEMDIVHMAGITDPAIVKQTMLNYSKTAYLNNTKAIIFVAERSTPYYQNSLAALAELRTWVDTHSEQFTEGETIYVNLSDLIRNFSQAMAPFRILSSALPTNGYENRPRIIINTTTHTGK